MKRIGARSIDSTRIIGFIRDLVGTSPLRSSNLKLTAVDRRVPSRSQEAEESVTEDLPSIKGSPGIELQLEERRDELK